MKLGQLHRNGEVHALRWAIPFLGIGQAVCHTRGLRVIGAWEVTRENNPGDYITCNRCRRKLNMMPLVKGPLPVSEPTTFEEAVHEGRLAGTLPKPSNDFPGYTPSILFAEPKEE